MPRYLPQKATISHDPTPPMLARPKLAVHIARIVTAWARVDEIQGQIVVYMLGGHAHTGMKMYQALSGAGAQKAVLRAVALERLSSEINAELEELLRRQKGVASKRNDIVHGHWFISEDFPEDLVWQDQSDSLTSHSEFWSGYTEASTGGHETRMSFLSEFRYSKSNVMILFGEKELQDVIASVQDLLNDLRAFGVRVHNLK